NAKVRRAQDAGYRPLFGSLEASTFSFRLAPGKQRALPFRCDAGGEYAILAIVEGVDDVALFAVDDKVVNGENQVVGDDRSANAEVRFRASEAGLYYAVVVNPKSREAVVVVVRLKK